MTDKASGAIIGDPAKSGFLMSATHIESVGSARPDDQPKPIQRIRIRKCGAKLRVPAEGAIGDLAETVFTCQREKGHEVEHSEVGTVQMDNSTGRDFVMTWTDVGVRSMRERKARGGSTKQG